MRNNTGTIQTVDYWREKINCDVGLLHMLEKLKTGRLSLGSTRNWDINWLTVALAADETELALEMLRVHDEQWGIRQDDLTLKQRIAMLHLLQDEPHAPEF